MAGAYGAGRRRDGAGVRARGRGGPDDPDVVGAARGAFRARGARAGAGGRSRSAPLALSARAHLRAGPEPHGAAAGRAGNAQRRVDDQRAARRAGAKPTIGIPLVSGRDLAWSDVKAAPHVVLVNEAFVRRLIPKGEPLGRRINQILGPGNDPWTIAGVIGDVHTKGLDRAPAPLIVVPLMQYTVPGLRVAMRAASGEPMSLLAALRADVAALDPDLPLSAARPLAQIVNESVNEQRFQMTLLSIFAVLALALAALGIYGVTAYSVAQRTREIGIRMALGADSSLVRRMVVGSGLRLALAGVAVGLAGALAGTRVLASLVYRVSTTDPLTLASTAAVLVISALLASWIPARRATRVDPAVSLRAE
ncbi:MAG: FtsX-like permease family protein [Deltaproteobacteria bacterium]|nr:MAG: FtsX-like permease family protein [Deltaproteobacteria bacterium]